MTTVELADMQRAAQELGESLGSCKLALARAMLRIETLEYRISVHNRAFPVGTGGHFPIEEIDLGVPPG